IRPGWSRRHRLAANRVAAGPAPAATHHCGGRTPPSGSHLILARATACPLARHYLSPDEQLAAPHSPGLPALDRTSQAGAPGRTATAERLGKLDIIWRFGEEQVRLAGAWKRPTPDDPGRPG